MVRERPFADHHAFANSEIEALVAEAGREKLTLVTTEKDLARLRNPAGVPVVSREVVAFPVTLEFEDAAALRKFVAERLFKSREKKFRTTA